MPSGSTSVPDSGPRVEAHRAHPHADRPGEPSDPDAVRVTVVGAGTLLPDPPRASAGHFLEAGAARILLDCGPGVYRGMERLDLPWDRLTHLVLSHWHTDHIGDLPGLVFGLAHALRPPRTAPLVVLGPRGLVRRFDQLAQAFGSHFEDPGFDLALVELGGGERWRPSDGSFVLSCHRTPHTEDSLAYRWEGGGGTVGYTGDTGPSEEVAGFLAGSELLISECAFPDPPPDDNHLSPRSVAEMARTAAPDLLLLTHVYPPQTPEEAARRVAEEGWGGRVEPARDGTSVTLGDGAPTLDRPGTRP